MTFEMKFSQEYDLPLGQVAILAACLPRSTKRSTRHLGIGHARLTVGSTKQHVANGRHNKAPRQRERAIRGHPTGAAVRVEHARGSQALNARQLSAAWRLWIDNHQALGLEVNEHAPVLVSDAGVSPPAVAARQAAHASVETDSHDRTASQART